MILGKRRLCVLCVCRDAGLEVLGFLPLRHGAVGQALARRLGVLGRLHHGDDLRVGKVDLDASSTGHITAHVGAVGAAVALGDNGVGVAPALHQRIFEPFFTTRRGSGGTGLGLNIVYTLVTQRLGGRLEFTSDSAAGLCFRLELPWRAPWQTAPEDESERGEAAP